MSSAKIVCVGGGSYNWCPKLLNDIIQTEEMEGCEIFLLDKNLKAAEDIKALGEALCKKHSRNIDFIATTSEDSAFRNADFALITITTGGLKAMKNDLDISEKYKVFHTVGDTVGPGGWSRTWRNVPVFVKMAEKIEKLSPKAFILNYTNPMYSLTSTLNRVSNLKTVGLCHGVFSSYKMLQNIFGVEEKDINITFGGLNHFFWVFDFTVNGKPGYPLLKKKLGKKTLCEFNGGKQPLLSELYHTYGYLTYGDRHVSEFIPQYVTGNEMKLKKYGLVRTSIKAREQGYADARNRTHDIIKGKLDLGNRSRETAVDIMKAVITKKPFIDVTNLPNIGQIDNLPRGAIVETLGKVDSLGFTPLAAGNMPEVLKGLTMPHIICQDMLVDAAIRRDRKQALEALHIDPSCSHLFYKEIKEMGEALFKANESWVK